MGQEASVVTPNGTDREVSNLELEIGKTRGRLGVYLSELDRRRHQFARAFKRISLILLGAGAVAGAVAIYFKIRSDEG